MEKTETETIRWLGRWPALLWPSRWPVRETLRWLCWRLTSMRTETLDGAGLGFGEAGRGSALATNSVGAQTSGSGPGGAVSTDLGRVQTSGSGGVGQYGAETFGGAETVPIVVETELAGAVQGHRWLRVAHSLLQMLPRFGQTGTLQLKFAHR